MIYISLARLAVTAVILLAALGACCWLISYRFGYDRGETDATEDCHRRHLEPGGAPWAESDAAGELDRQARAIEAEVQGFIAEANRRMGRPG